jgi:hypothetical protein
MIFTDAAFSNTINLHSQIDYVICLTNDVYVNQIHWSSIKCKRIIKSVLTIELYVMINDFDVEAIIKSIIEHILNLKNSLLLILCHEMWLLIILRMRKPCINDKTIAKLMIIREELYSKDVMWSTLRYSTCSNHLHILIWRWIILIELTWWLQLLSRNSIIIKARNFIIKLTT